jgi:hypothetical protein
MTSRQWHVSSIYPQPMVLQYYCGIIILMVKRLAAHSKSAHLSPGEFKNWSNYWTLNGPGFRDVFVVGGALGCVDVCRDKF